MFSPPSLPDPITELLTTYNELNSSTIDELSEVPSALEFMRYVAINRPFVIRGGASDWEATKTWTKSSLRERLSGRNVTAAITPHGNADSPIRNSKGDLVFMLPLLEQQKFEDLIDFISAQEIVDERPEEVRYSQTQNNNLHSEFAPLLSSLPSTLPFAHSALSKPPDATNFWLGNSHSVTALHNDPYENIYIQVIGQKHFVLLPPVFYPVVAEKPLQQAIYERGEDGKLMIKELEGPRVPFPTWAPDGGDQGRYKNLVSPMRVTLGKGDMLYLPALWYHKVSQTCDDEGICCAVNYWYDMSYEGGFYPLCGLVRRVAMAAEGEPVSDSSIARGNYYKGGADDVDWGEEK